MSLSNSYISHSYKTKKARGKKSNRLNRALGVQAYSMRGVPFKNQPLSLRGYISPHQNKILALTASIALYMWIPSIASFF